MTARSWQDRDRRSEDVRESTQVKTDRVRSQGRRDKEQSMRRRRLKEGGGEDLCAAGYPHADEGSARHIRIGLASLYTLSW